MNGELERLKADLEVLERYHGYSILENARADLADKVARLEADADPWGDVKRFVEIARQCNAGLRTTWEQSRRLAEFIDHLTAEIARLEKENRALGRKVEIDGRLIANLEQENLDWLDEIRDRAKERDEALARVAELEAAAKAEDEEDLGDAEEALANLKAFVSEFPPRREEDKSCRSIADMIPPFEGPIESIEPILDPARVLATAAEAFEAMGMPSMRSTAAFHAEGAKPYKLKWGDK